MRKGQHSPGIYKRLIGAVPIKPDRYRCPGLGPPTARDIRCALQTLARAGVPAELLEALEAWSDDQMQQAA